MTGRCWKNRKEEEIKGTRRRKKSWNQRRKGPEAATKQNPQQRGSKSCKNKELEAANEKKKRKSKEEEEERELEQEVAEAWRRQRKKSEEQIIKLISYSSALRVLNHCEQQKATL